MSMRAFATTIIITLATLAGAAAGIRTTMPDRVYARHAAERAADEARRQAEVDAIVKQFLADNPIGMEEYNALYPAMSYARACEILGGPGTELASTGDSDHRMVNYMWKNRNGSNVNATFYMDFLQVKGQAGLR